MRKYPGRGTTPMNPKLCMCFKSYYKTIPTDVIFYYSFTLHLKM